MEKNKTEPKESIWPCIFGISFVVAMIAILFILGSYENQNRECLNPIAEKYCESLGKPFLRSDEITFICAEDDYERKHVYQTFYFTDAERKGC